MIRVEATGRADVRMRADTGLSGPVIDEDSAVFWEGTRRHELRLERCRACGEVRFPPMPHCPNCGSSDASIEQADPVGRVYSWITIHRPMSGLQPDDLPCTFVVVDLAAGCRMVGRLTGAWEGTIGDPVAAVFVDHQDWSEMRFQAARGSRADS
jgi:hypothetical protein